jgi:hypothetical protein
MNNQIMVVHHKENWLRVWSKCRHEISDSLFDSLHFMAIMNIAGCPPHPAAAAERRLTYLNLFYPRLTY